MYNSSYTTLSYLFCLSISIYYKNLKLNFYNRIIIDNYMLSTIIYETTDFIYTVSRIAINSVTKLYKWYYSSKELSRLDAIEKKIFLI